MKNLLVRLTCVALPLGVGMPAISPIHAVSAQAQDLTTVVPKTASPWPELASRMQPLLVSVIGEKEADLKISGTPGEAQVFAWRGNAYKKDRLSFTQMTLNGALGKAGYKVRALDSNLMADVRLFEHFPSDEESVPFHPDIWKLPVYFIAKDEAHGRAVVGALLEGDSALVLGLLPVALQKAAAAPMPAVPAGAIAVNDANDAMKGAKPTAVTFSPLARKPRTARGQVKDAAGRPLAGAVVHAESSVLGGIRTLHEARTNAQGIYEIPLSSGVCRVTAAFKTLAYNGKNYGLSLRSADGNLEAFDSGRGTVENFVLRTWGATKSQTANDPSNPTLYYGGSVRLVWTSAMGEGGMFEVTLTPKGLLLGGGTGKTLVFRVPNKYYDAVLNDIPLGRYSAQVRLVMDGETAPVRLEKYGSRSATSSLQVDFEPVSATSPDFGYSSVRQFLIALEP